MQGFISTVLDASRIVEPALLRLGYMDTNLALRLQVQRLVGLGLSQKVLAGAMGIDPSTLSKWMHGKRDTQVSVGAMDGLRAFLSALREEVTRDVTQVTLEDHQRLSARHHIAETEQRIATRVRQAVKSRAAKKPSQRGKRVARQ